MKKILFFATFVLCVLLFSEKSYAYCNHVWILDEYDIAEPTCVDDGYYSYYCDECFDYKTVIRPKTGIHTWGEWEADSYLCQDGIYERYCDYCGKKEEKTRKGNGNHPWTNWETICEPTCVSKGEQYRYCKDCYEEETRYTEAIPDNHYWGSWYYEKQPTALKSGKMKRECFECFTVEIKTCKKLKAKIKLSAKSKTLKRGKKYTLKLKSYTYGDKIKSFKSSNKKVATVTKKGKITAKKRGTAKITVTMKSGCKATCKIKVK